MSRKNKMSLKEKFALKNSLVKEALSEFLGTFILISIISCGAIKAVVRLHRHLWYPTEGVRLPPAWQLVKYNIHITVLHSDKSRSLGCLFADTALGCGCVGQAVLSRGVHGGPMTVSVGFAMAVTIAVYVSGGVSGGHINPAVSLAMCVAGRLKWAKLPIYILAQLLGAFVGAAAVFGIYHDAFMEYSNGTLEVTGPYATAHIFATYPAPYLSLINGFADQVMSTAVLLLVIFAIFDTRNNSVPKGLEPVVVGLLVIVLTCSLGMNSGCAMNPARDLGPRLFTAIGGWGMEVFTAGNNWWWVPIVAPMLGGVLGALTYIIFIEIHHSEIQHAEENDVYDKHELTNM